MTQTTSFFFRVLPWLTVFTLFLTACQTSPDQGPREVTPRPVSPIYDQEMQEILELARADRWEEAVGAAELLYLRDPENPDVERIYNWAVNENRRRRQLTLESELRAIEQTESRFSPTLRSALTDRHSRRLDLPTDLRNTMDEIDRSPLVPETYGRVIEETGRLYNHKEQRGAMENLLEREVTIQADNMPLEEIIFTMGEDEGINFIADRSLPAFQQTLSVNMQNVKLSEFLRHVSWNLDVGFQVGSNLIWIVESGENTLFEETRFYRLNRGFILPAQFGAHESTRVTTGRGDDTRVTETEKMERFVQDGAPLYPTMQTVIERFFRGSDFMIDYERNIIIATGTWDQLQLLEEIIEEFDKPIQQVLIKAEFVTVSQAAFMQLGMTWETGRDPLADQRTPTDFTGFGTNVGLGLEHSFTNILSRPTLSATLSALQQQGESQTLSSPRMTVTNNLPATMQDGKTQYYYEEYTVSQTITDRRSVSQLVPQGRPTELRSGVTLNVLASIGGDGKSIMLALNPKVSSDVELVTFATVSDRDEDGRLVSSFDILLPESRDQEMSTRVMVHSGETVVMGGVVERVQSTFTESVPILGSIPIIGAAFRKRTEFDQPRYLLIFVTATLLSESGEFISRRAMELE